MSLAVAPLAPSSIVRRLTRGLAGELTTCLRAHRTGAGRALLAALAAALPATPAVARAWDEVGHQAIALVAWQALSPAARARAAALLRAAPPATGLAALRPATGGPGARDRALFARAAAWPDYVKDRRAPAEMRAFNRPTWHYVGTAWRAGRDGRPVIVATTDARRTPEDPVERVRTYLPLIADATRPAAERAVALAWVLHLVGDLHQPLHAGSRVTAEHPEGDRGGNEVAVGSSNLHALWDDALDTGRPRRGAGGAPGPDARTAQAAGVAERVARRWPASAVRARVAETDPARWVAESLTLAATTVYPGTGDGGPVSPAYRARMRAAAEPQAAVAGYRLAALLERALTTGAAG